MRRRRRRKRHHRRRARASHAASFYRCQAAAAVRGRRRAAACCCCSRGRAANAARVALVRTIYAAGRHCGQGVRKRMQYQCICACPLIKANDQPSRAGEGGVRGNSDGDCRRGRRPRTWLMYAFCLTHLSPGSQQVVGP